MSEYALLKEIVSFLKKHPKVFFARFARDLFDFPRRIVPKVFFSRYARKYAPKSFRLKLRENKKTPDFGSPDLRET